MSAAAPRPFRVLLADDMAEVVEGLAAVFAQAGFETGRAFDGIAALEAIATFQPDAAVLDISMPGMSGYDVARAARRNRGTSLLLVALTGHGDAQDVERAYEAGFDYHFTKPVHPPELLHLVRAVCQTRRRHEDRVATSSRGNRRNKINPTET